MHFVFDAFLADVALLIPEQVGRARSFWIRTASRWMTRKAERSRGTKRRLVYMISDWDLEQQTSEEDDTLFARVGFRKKVTLFQPESK